MNNVLHCFYSWGRKDYTEKCFNSLLKNKRPQDKILVIDQEGHNIDFYKGKADFIFVTQKNYQIGPVWMYIKNFVNWVLEVPDVYGRTSRLSFSAVDDVKWKPDFINVVESDALGKDGWIDKLIRVFELDEYFGIVTGYDAPEHKVMKIHKGIKIKDITPSVQMMFRTEHFMKLYTYLPFFSQDIEICIMNKKLYKTIGVLSEIEHIGINGKNKGLVL